MTHYFSPAAKRLLIPYWFAVKTGIKEMRWAMASIDSIVQDAVSPTFRPAGSRTTEDRKVGEIYLYPIGLAVSTGINEMR